MRIICWLFGHRYQVYRPSIHWEDWWNQEMHNKCARCGEKI